MGEYRLECDFDITRRIGWLDGDLGEHIDDVLDRMHQADGVTEVEAHAELDSGRTTVSVTVVTSADDPRHLACAALGIAIRSCNGAHIGLLPLGEEAVVKVGRNSWSGLRTPTWHVRQSRFDENPPDTHDGTLGS